MAHVCIRNLQRFAWHHGQFVWSRTPTPNSTPDLETHGRWDHQFCQLIQTAFRAELTAFVAALQYGAMTTRPIRIWTDCLGVLRKFNSLVLGHGKIRTNSANADLWFRLVDLVEHIGIDRISVFKVAAHRTLPANASWHERWIHYHNAAVDFAAKGANFDRPKSVWTLWEQLVLQTTGLQKICSAMMAYHLQVGQLWSSLAQPPKILRPPQPRRAKLGPRMEFRCDPTVDGPLGVTRRILGDDHARRLWSWWVDFIDIEQAPVQWVSFAQMYIHFQLTKRHLGAVRVGKRWRDPALSPILQPEQYTFKVRSRGYIGCNCNRFGSTIPGRSVRERFGRAQISSLAS